MATATMERPTSQATEDRLTSELRPIWPRGMKIPFIALSGEYSAGKTIFGLTIDPKNTIVFDTEDSSESYEGSLGFTRIDLPEEMQRRFPDGKYRPAQLFLAWREMVGKLPKNRYTVMVLDTGSEVEKGHTEWVRQNPNLFGYTSAQFAKSEALVWGAAKDSWKQILSDITSRVQTFVIVMHMRDEWIGGRPTGKREAKGLDTIEELASLSLILERRADAKGKVPEKPAAIVLKSRLSVFTMNEATGEMEAHPVLPPRIPECTPATIRRYITNPPDYAKLKKDELAVADGLTEDERLLLQARISENNAETARINSATIEQRAEIAKRQSELAAAAPAATNSDRSAETVAKTEAKAVEHAATATAAEEAPHAADTNGHATSQQISELLWFKQSIPVSDKDWQVAMTKRGVADAKSLTVEQADEMLAKLRAKVTPSPESKAAFDKLKEEGKRKPKASPEPAADKPAVSDVPFEMTTAAPADADPTNAAVAGKATKDQVLEMIRYRDLLGISLVQWGQILAKKNVAYEGDLSQADADTFLANLGKKHQARETSAGLKAWGDKIAPNPTPAASATA